MNVLYVIASLDKRMGGTVNSVLNYYYSIRNNVDVTIVSTFTKNETEYLDDLVTNDANILNFEIDVHVWRFSVSFLKYLTNNISKFDVVHIHGMWLFPTYYAAKCAYKNNIPYIVSPHGMVKKYALDHKKIRKKIYWKLVEEKIFNRAKCIHCITSGEQDSIRMLSSSETFLLANGVAVGEYKNNINLCEGYFLFLGRLDPIKGLDNLICSMNMVDNIKLVIVGDGDKRYVKHLQKMTSDLQLSERVSFVGFVDKANIYKLFNEALATVVCSYTEVFSLVALESIANSTPVVISSQCDFDDIEKYNAGVITKSNSPADIANGIEKIMNMDYDTLSKNAHNLALSKFSIDIIGNNLLTLYNGTD